MIKSAPDDELFIRGLGTATLAIEALDGAKYHRAVRADVSMPGASLLKIPIVLAVYDAVDRGELDFSACVPRASLGATRYPSVLDVLDPDRGFSVAELCGVALATSDNLAADYLLSMLGFERLNASILSYGMANTQISVGFRDNDLNALRKANYTTAYDFLQLFKFLYSGSSNGQSVLRTMSNSLFKSRIGLRLPENLTVANKTGSLNGVVNDAGIVSDGRLTVAFVFLTREQPDEAITALRIGDLTWSTWRELGGQVS